MIRGVITVGHDRVYDLYFRVRTSQLENGTYSLEFLNWIKAGVAYNIRGVEVSSRKISYFAELYGKVMSGEDMHPYTRELRVALSRFYEDLYRLYHDHVTAARNAAGKKGNGSIPLITNLLLVPAFEQTPFMRDLFPTREVIIDDYVPQHPLEMNREQDTIHLESKDVWYKAMALYYDCGVKTSIKANSGASNSEESAFLLEVTKCQ